MERLVVEVWKDVLHVSSIRAQDNFFKLGGHSLLAMEILIRLHERVGAGFSIGFFLEHPTPREQAAAIIEELEKRRLVEGALPEKAGQQFQGERTIPLRDRSVSCPLSPAQQRIWFVEQLHPGLPIYVESQAVRMQGPLDPKVVEAALNAIVVRHEMLRTGIRIGGDGNPAQFLEAEATLALRRISFRGDEASLQRLLSEEARQPFDLTSPPLLRATLIEAAPDDHVLIIVMHHIACDGYSLGVFFEELSLAYSALASGKAYAPRALSIQYGDYAAWKCSEGRQGKVEQDLLYWKGGQAGVRMHIISPLA